MTGMTRKEIDALVKHIKPQGVTVEPTKSGLRLRLPNGETASVHWTQSDVNSFKPVRSALKRAGVTWPTDAYTAPKEKPVAKLAKYITDGNVSEDSKKKVRLSIAAIAEGTGQHAYTVHQIVEHSGMDIVTVSKTLYHLGYEPVGEKKHNRVWAIPQQEVIELTPDEQETLDDTHPTDWEETINEHPEIARAILLREAEASVRLDKEGDGQTFSFETQPSPIVPLERGHVMYEAAHAVAEAKAIHKDIIEGKKDVTAWEGDERMVLDSHDSWVVSPTAGIKDLTILQLSAAYRAAGLQMEIRVWRDDK